MYDDEHLIFMDLALPNRMASLEADSRFQVNLVDVFRRRGYRFEGTAPIVPPGHPAYDWLNSWLLQANGPGYPAHRAALIRVERVLPVLSPAYTFGIAEDTDLVESWRARYAAVRPASADPMGKDTDGGPA
ncbi:hypothetical protein [Micromonospora sp. NPDC005806]|uniref:hypothetical protein n=1 Tax=Micromonospora sp. NPDC005806 TaxID=3364234 RepID=UPI003675A887